MMDYISQQLLPGALSDCAAAVLVTISKAGVWMPWPADLNFDQLRALLALRNAGYIEYAAYSGYKIKGQHVTIAGQKNAPPETSADTVRALLLQYGVTPVAVTECRDARKRPGNAPSWAIQMPAGVRIPAAVWERLESGAWCNGNLFVVQVKE